MTSGEKSEPITFRQRVLSHKGMTLLEIMIVIALIGMIGAFGITKLGGKGRELKKAVRRMSVLSRNLHTKAKLFNKTYRIAIKMDEKETHQYWVESASGKITVMSEAQKEEQEKLTEAQREKLKKKNSFSKDNSVIKGVLELPKPLYFSQVEYSDREDPVEIGMAYIHFFPQGLVEEAAIHITDGQKMNWTVIFHPVTGKTDVISKDIALKDVREFSEE